MTNLIVEMEMPTGCSWVEKGIEKRCPMAGIDHYLQIRCRVQSGRIVHTINKSGGVDRPSWCPIKCVLPEEHGDLIDRDKAKDAFDSSFLTFRMKDGETMRGFYQRTIAELPTVIAAERKDDEQIY